MEDIKLIFSFVWELMNIKVDLLGLQVSVWSVVLVCWLFLFVFGFIASLGEE